MFWQLLMCCLALWLAWFRGQLVTALLTPVTRLPYVNQAHHAAQEHSSCHPIPHASLARTVSMRSPGCV